MQNNAQVDVRTTPSDVRDADAEKFSGGSNGGGVELQDDAILKEFAKSAEEQSGCAAAAALWLSAYMAFLNAANDTFACTRARAPRVCEGAMCFAAKSPRFSRHTRAFRLVTAPKSPPRAAREFGRVRRG